MKIETFHEALLKEENNLRNYAYSLTWDRKEAEDLLQDTFLRAMIKQNTLQHTKSLKSWLFTVMRNIFINKYRSKVRRGEMLIDEMTAHPGRNTAADMSTLDPILKREIYEKILSLPNELKEPFLLLTDGFKYKEIADKLNLSIGTIKSRIYEARKILIKKLKADENPANPHAL
jgi:RNA polymerase sigma-70 factor (ECF subfamily)